MPHMVHTLLRENEPSYRLSLPCHATEKLLPAVAVEPGDGGD